jgi:hypothetical protein
VTLYPVRDEFFVDEQTMKKSEGDLPLEEF